MHFEFSFSFSRSDHFFFLLFLLYLFIKEQQRPLRMFNRRKNWLRRTHPLFSIFLLLFVVAFLFSLSLSLSLSLSSLYYFMYSLDYLLYSSHSSVRIGRSAIEFDQNDPIETRSLSQASVHCPLLT